MLVKGNVETLCDARAKWHASRGIWRCLLSKEENPFLFLSLNTWAVSFSLFSLFFTSSSFEQASGRNPVSFIWTGCWNESCRVAQSSMNRFLIANEPLKKWLLYGCMACRLRLKRLGLSCHPPGVVSPTTDKKNTFRERAEQRRSTIFNRDCLPGTFFGAENGKRDNVLTTVTTESFHGPLKNQFSLSRHPQLG